MNKRGTKPIARSLIAVVFLLSAVGSMRVAGAAKEDCRPDGEAHAFQCMWDEEDFQGNMRPILPTDLAGLCINYTIRSAANNGTSGFATLYLYEQADCTGGSAISKLNAGESVPSVTAQSARFAPRGAYP